MNPNDLNERKLQILQAIIADFITTGEPVGSRSLSKSHDMGISPATIRNEMSDLEEMGYLTHPHTSAGRVPSDKAYRLYVDELMDTSQLDEADKQKIRTKLLESRNELDSTIELPYAREFADAFAIPITIIPDEEHTLSDHPETPDIVADLAIAFSRR